MGPSVVEESFSPIRAESQSWVTSSISFLPFMYALLTLYKDEYFSQQREKETIGCKTTLRHKDRKTNLCDWSQSPPRGDLLPERLLRIKRVPMFVTYVTSRILFDDNGDNVRYWETSYVWCDVNIGYTTTYHFNILSFPHFIFGHPYP